ncbi:MAG TPA: hypothetical protein DEE98_05710 [Elusimicrobia bacterium]|nr:MAG: hypothetical protein A2278_00945 [Elusimicrobia bacterium RIFOXYA12_FULL_49_49]OGS11417.1 MAG: hypothetical protein A2386_04850 [Elusimicrobia bacterium RIFOXYB1_FULL_48_9]OGS15044.1 MAG: hypothetical protein A2251_00095 [Elusimicrobia bacterium RIFOXYA2_FULL_47_53]OGS29382.1 MAG: hypothetical protein A2323_00380 [Elusimicrobia bacterium RIFOXYB2_FULL_46_23]HBU69863.1 hypothetical protein [Elusimicrobiota bacterium]
MKKLIAKILSTSIAALMMLNVLSSTSMGYNWNTNLIQSQTSYSYAANGILQIAKSTDGLGQNAQISHFNIAGQLAYTTDGDNKVLSVRHYNAAGNLTSADFTSNGADGAPHVYTTFYIDGAAVTVDRGAIGKDGLTITSNGSSGGTNNYTVAQVQQAFADVLAGRKTWKEAGINVSNVSLTGSQIANLDDAGLARVFNLSTITGGTGAIDPNNTFKIGDTVTGGIAGEHIVGSVTIDGTTYGLSSNGNLVRRNASTGQYQVGSWGTFTQNADGSLKVVVKHNTMNGANSWTGECTVNTDGTVTVSKTDTGKNALTTTQGAYTTKTASTAGSGLKDANSYIINGKLYYEKDGKLFTSTGVEVGTIEKGKIGDGITVPIDDQHVTQIQPGTQPLQSYSKITWKIEGQTLGLDAIRAAAKESPYSTFTVQMGADGLANTLSYFDSAQQKSLTVNICASSLGSNAQRDPLVTGAINDVLSIKDANGVTHYYLSVNASGVDMFDGKGQKDADGETILIEVDAATAANMKDKVGQEITISGNVSASVDGHLTMTVNEGGYVVGEAGTTNKTWMKQNESFYKNMVNTMINVYDALGVGDASWKDQWNALANSSGPTF